MDLSINNKQKVRQAKVKGRPPGQICQPKWLDHRRVKIPQRGRQCECHNLSLWFPYKKLTTNIYNKRLTGQLMI